MLLEEKGEEENSGYNNDISAGHVSNRFTGHYQLINKQINKNNHSRGGQRVARPRLEFRDRDRDFYNFSLNIETETETENFKVSMSRPRPRLQISKLSRPRLIETLIFQSCRDRDSSRL